MASPDTPPPSWNQYAGVWNTDLLWDTTTFLTAGGAVRFLNTSPGGSFIALHSDLFGVTPGQPYALGGWGRADSNAAGRNLVLSVDWYDTANAFISTSWGYDAPAPAANTWFEASKILVAPANAMTGQIMAGRRTTNAFNGWWDQAGVTPMPRCARIHTSAASTAAGGSPANITLDVVDYDYGGFVSGSSFVAPAAGVYSIYGNVAGYATGGTEGFFQANLYSVTIGTPAGANTYMKWGVGASSPLPVFWQGPLARGDQVSLQFTYMGGLTGVGYNGSVYNNTWLSIVEVKA